MTFRADDNYECSKVLETKGYISFDPVVLVSRRGLPSFAILGSVGRKVLLKFTLVQALGLYTSCTAHRGSRGIALLFHDYGTRKGVREQRHAPGALYPRERPGIHCTGGYAA